jgi:hypothetical protein
LALIGLILQSIIYHYAMGFLGLMLSFCSAGVSLPGFSV